MTVNILLSSIQRRFVAVLTAFLVLMFVTTRAEKAGDFIEYGVTAIALGQHGTPEVRASDANLAMQYSPEAGIAVMFKRLRDGIQRGDTVPLPGFERSPSGGTYSIHYFAYPALAALPLRVLHAIGADPFKAFQFINYCALWILGLASLRLFGSGRRAGIAFIAVLIGGGILYANWCSPEIMSAALLLAGLMLFTTAMPVVGSVLAGIAAMHNPSIVCFALFAPLLAILDPTRWQTGAKSRYPILLTSSALHVLLAATPYAFFLWQFGTPSLIARYSTDPHLITCARLLSYYLDPNQGMIIGLPAIPILLLAPGRGGRRAAMMLVVTLAFMLALAVPTLATTNWNSGANGMMRYALWGSMPLFYLVFARLRDAGQWPTKLLSVVLVLQVFVMAHARSYSPEQFSPLGRLVLHYAHAVYNPDPDIFFTRAKHTDSGPDPRHVARWPERGPIYKAMVHMGNADASEDLCGHESRLLPSSTSRDAIRGWIYLDGPVECVPATRAAAR